MKCLDNLFKAAKLTLADVFDDDDINVEEIIRELEAEIDDRLKADAAPETEGE